MIILLITIVTFIVDLYTVYIYTLKYITVGGRALYGSTSVSDTYLMGEIIIVTFIIIIMVIIAIGIINKNALRFKIKMLYV